MCDDLDQQREYGLDGLYNHFVYILQVGLNRDPNKRPSTALTHDLKQQSRKTLLFNKRKQGNEKKKINEINITYGLLN